MALQIYSTEVLGARLLREVAAEEGSLEDGTVVVLDLDGRFSPSHLMGMGLSMADLGHVHVFRCSKERLKVTLQGLENYMLWGKHGSKGREWMSTFVLGGVGGDVMVGWRGWLGVERESVGTFGEGISVEEAWGERERRQEVVDGKGWRGICEMEEFSWG
ncbi:hypothetical protein F5882DRAFT_280136 [Hyaloscypha sp. PMI_1271]|nr:hypothetical protein F5882DRAFT_280136 [Hyaloscypha sp. PMI_1271]